MPFSRGAVLGAALALASPLWGATLSCGPMLDVSAPDAALADRVCTVVGAAAPLLETCDLRQSRGLALRVVEDRGALRPMGHYRRRSNEIVLLSPQDLTGALAEDSAYLQIAPLHLFDSIVVHELAHAIFANTRCGWETCLAGHEYVAYALQLQSLSAKDRQILMDALPASSTVDLAWFMQAQLRETPELFAMNAWRHFAQPGVGCSFVQRLIAGEIDFPSDRE